MFLFHYFKKFEMFPQALNLGIRKAAQDTAAQSVLFSSSPLDHFLGFLAWSKLQGCVFKTSARKLCSIIGKKKIIFVRCNMF